MEETLESLKNSLNPDDSDDDDFSSDTDSEKLSNEIPKSYNGSSSDNPTHASKPVKPSLMDQKSDGKLNEYLSGEIEGLRKVNRILNSFLLLHEDNSKNTYELLLYSLYTYCRQLGDFQNEFSQTTWKYFGSELKKFDKASTRRFRSGLKLRKSKKKNELKYPSQVWNKWIQYTLRKVGLLPQTIAWRTRFRYFGDYGKDLQRRRFLLPLFMMLK